MSHHRNGLPVCLLLAVLSCLGCQKPTTATLPDYDRELRPGEDALRRVIDIAQWPDFTPAFNQRGPALYEAIDRSLAWFALPSTQQHFPVQSFTHEHVRLSVLAFRQVLRISQSPQEFRSRLMAEFDVWESVGWDGSGTVLYTGYYTPIFKASRTATPEFRYPLYRRPADLVSDPATGAVLGQRLPDGGVGEYPSRAAIEASGMLRGQELVWMASELDAYLVHIQGSAKLELTDGTTLQIGYAGSNGHEYVSMAQAMIREGKLNRHRRGLPAIREYFNRNPEDLRRYLNINPRFIFFQEYAAANWPAGSLGFRVTPGHSLATDKRIFPRAAVVLVHTSAPTASGGSGATERFSQFMLDQDTGGAIKAPGRGDIYYGIGPDAEELAGRQFAEGYLYYLILKPARVEIWRRFER